MHQSSLPDSFGLATGPQKAAGFEWLDKAMLFLHCDGQLSNVVLSSPNQAGRRGSPDCRRSPMR